jgi:hypothetical protein
METVLIYSAIASILAIGAFFLTRFFIKSMAMRVAMTIVFFAAEMAALVWWLTTG